MSKETCRVKCDVCECAHNSCEDNCCKLSCIEITHEKASDDLVAVPHFCKSYRRR